MIRLILLSSMVIVSLLVVPAAGAAGNYYCSPGVLVGGEGTAADPWACVTADQFNARAAEVCRAGGGVLYFMFEGGYVSYTVNPDCSVIPGEPNPGTPPSAGVDLPGPWLLALAAIAAAGLIAVGMILRRPRRPGV